MVESSAVHPVTPSTPAPVTASVCPYLLAADGRWRAATPAREHRCTAVTPPAVLAADKQKRLCLAPEHLGCATYQVATGEVDRSDGAGTPRVERGRRQSTRQLVRTAPLVLDHGRIPLPRAAVGDRSLGHGALLLLMAVAFGAIIIARLSSGGDAGGGGSLVAAGTTATPVVTASPAAGGATSGPSADGEPIRTLVPTEVEPSDSPAPSVAESPAPSAVPSASPEPAERPTTYRVRRGDTLSGIAAEFGTTVAALAALNDISDPSRLRAGQVLKLPQD